MYAEEKPQISAEKPGFFLPCALRLASRRLFVFSSPCPFVFLSRSSTTEAFIDHRSTAKVVAKVVHASRLSPLFRAL